jgi:internalin A
MKTKIKKHKGIFIALTAVVSAAVLFTVLYYAMTVNIDGRRVSKNAKSIDLSTIDLDEKPITNISGISECKNAEELNLAYDDISDISEIGEMKNLQEIHLDNNNKIKDISVLIKLKKLKMLGLNGLTNIDDVSMISKISNLERLYMSGCQLYEINFIENSFMKKLDISYNNITSISSVENMPDLYYFNAMHNRISDISSLKSCKKIKKCILDYNEINDIKCFESNNMIGELSLEHNEINDLTALYNCKNLKGLNIYDNPVTKEQVDQLQQHLPDCEILSDYS